MSQIIPIHDFQKDSKDSIPFRFIPLNAGSGYDTTLPHRHNYHEIFFFQKGGGTHTIDFNEVPVKPSSVHFISPGQVHLMNRSAESYGVIVLFSREFYYCNGSNREDLYTFPFLHNNTVLPVMELQRQDFAVFEMILQQLKTETETNKNVEVIRAYLQLILLKCKALFEVEKKITPSKDQELFMQYRTLVEKHYRVERHPAFFASALCITEKKLNLVCKANAGISAGQYIRDRVLLEAKRLLHNADYSAKEIGYFLGFEDPSYFNRFFKANAGITAVAFRKGQIEIV